MRHCLDEALPRDRTKHFIFGASCCSKRPQASCHVIKKTAAQKKLAQRVALGGVQLSLTAALFSESFTLKFKCVTWSRKECILLHSLICCV
eukprot:2541016-Amphidinium_carterae.1